MIMRAFLCSLVLALCNAATAQPINARVAPEVRSAQVNNARIEPNSNSVSMFNGAARTSGLSDWMLDLLENVGQDAVHLRYSSPDGVRFCEATVGRLQARDQEEANQAAHHLLESISQRNVMRWTTWQSEGSVEFSFSQVLPDGHPIPFYSGIEARYTFPDDIQREAIVINKFCVSPARYVVMPGEFRRFQVLLSAPPH